MLSFLNLAANMAFRHFDSCARIETLPYWGVDAKPSLSDAQSGSQNFQVLVTTAGLYCSMYLYKSVSPECSSCFTFEASGALVLYNLLNACCNKWRMRPLR